MPKATLLNKPQFPFEPYPQLSIKGKRHIESESLFYPSGEEFKHHDINHKKRSLPIINSQNMLAGNSNRMNINNGYNWESYGYSSPVREDMNFYITRNQYDPQEIGTLHGNRQLFNGAVTEMENQYNPNDYRTFYYYPEPFHNAFTEIKIMERNKMNEAYIRNGIHLYNPSLPHQNQLLQLHQVMEMGNMNPYSQSTSLAMREPIASASVHRHRNNPSTTMTSSCQGLPRHNSTESDASCLSRPTISPHYAKQIPSKRFKTETLPDGCKNDTPLQLRKPFSGYNIFFSYDREIILALLPDRETCCQSPIAQMYSSSKKNTKSTPSGTTSIEITEETKEADVDFYIDLIKKTTLTKDEISSIVEMAKKNSEMRLASIFETAKPRKSHRKSHGKICFTSLSKLISHRWHQLSEEEKNSYHERSNQDRLRYNLDLDYYSSIKNNVYDMSLCHS